MSNQEDDSRDSFSQTCQEVKVGEGGAWIFCNYLFKKNFQFLIVADASQFRMRLLKSKVKGIVALNWGQSDDIMEPFAHFMSDFMKKILDSLIALQGDLTELFLVIADDKGDGVG